MTTGPIGCVATARILILLGLVPHVAGAEPRLTVNVNNLAGFEATTVAKAEEIAADLFHEMGIELKWQLTGNCYVNRAASELCINLVPSSPAVMGLHIENLGLAAVTGRDQPGFEAWVFQPAVENVINHTPYLLRHRGRSLYVVLGHVMAHELGHLLLNSAEHSHSGVMTARWDHATLQLASMGMLRFSQKESAGIRARVQAMRALTISCATWPRSRAGHLGFRSRPTV